MICYQITAIEDNKTLQFEFRGERDALTSLLTVLEPVECRVSSINISKQNEADVPIVIAFENADDPPWCDFEQVPWLLWNRPDDATINKEAFDRGAFCVLPGVLELSSLLASLQNATVVIQARGSRQSTALRFKRQFNRGERIHMEEDRVIQIQRGAMRSTSLHNDGSEVLIGFYGPGDVLVAHTTHSCHVEMTAHTSLAVTYERWAEASRKPAFYARLKERICQMELWSSMQARPVLEERLLGILQVIAGKFATQTEDGLLLQIKITHEQLAGAIGATRTTVTRLLGNLRKAGKLSTRKNANGEFFLLNAIEDCCHH